MVPFAHLHVHSEYSLLDCACRIEQLVERVSDLGQTSCALTDHGVMYGVIDFYRACKAKGIHPVIGCGILIGFICGFIGAGGGMMMLLILTSVLGYELKTAVGTSVFIMTFTALTGAVSHFAIGGAPDWHVWALCVVFTLLWARIAAVFANKADAKTLNRATGIILVILGVVVMGFNWLS